MRRLRILYDFEAFSDQERGGITRYVLELSKRVAQESDVLLYSGIHRSHALLEERPSFAHGWYLPAIKNTGEMRRQLNALLTRRAIARFQPDIIHRTYYRHACPYNGGHAEIVTLYDLICFRFPDLAPGSEVINERMRLAVSRANHVICISQNTRADAKRWLSVDATRSSVIPLGVRLPISTLSAPQVLSPYVLFVGQRGGYKNFELFLQALASAPDLNHFAIVAFGGGSINQEELKAISRLGLNQRVHWQQGDDHDLAVAYTHAACLVYPSLYEGFGLPLVEAMSYGCPVVCSNSSCLPEIAGTAAEYFAPNAPSTLVDALRRVLNNPQHSERLKQAGPPHAATFTWDQCANQTQAIYRQLVSRAVTRQTT